MRRHFCTLFDKNYLYKGIALYRSLERHSGEPFTLWILCMDNLTYDAVSKMNLKHAKAISFDEFKTEKLLELKKERTVSEFSWTCTASLCAYMLEKEKVDEVTYLDADIYFFSHLSEIFDEIGGSSIALIEHRFPPKRRYLEYKGKYNVSWVTLKNNMEGRGAAFWWRDRVLEWCYNKYENGKFGDQLYLNDWLVRFKDVCIIKHPRAGIAPWNISDFKEGVPIFYHFHGFHFFTNGSFLAAGNYYIPPSFVKSLYQPYFEELSSISRQIREIDPNFYLDSVHISLWRKMANIFFKSRLFEDIFLFFARVKSKI